MITVLTVMLQGHINLGKKGYRVPCKGTLQLTLFNPLGTVVKMFVVQYDLSDMPPSSQVSYPAIPCPVSVNNVFPRLLMNRGPDQSGSCLIIIWQPPGKSYSCRISIRQLPDQSAAA